MRQKALLYRRRLPRQTVLFGFFCCLGGFIFLRLVMMQVVDGGYRQAQLLNQHYTSSELKANRGQIYMVDRSDNEIQLTENIDYFTVFVDPKFMPDKQELIAVMTPILYEHLCEVNGVDIVTPKGCLENLERFTRQELIPKEFGEFVVTTGDALYYVALDEFTEQIDEIVTNFTQEAGLTLIQQRLDQMIQPGMRELNYVGVTEDQELLAAFSSLSYTAVQGGFMYIRPDAVIDKDAEAQRLYQLLNAYEFPIQINTLRALTRPQENRYVKIIDGINAKLADRLEQEKRRAVQEFSELDRQTRNAMEVSVLHGVGLEKYQKRYYPHERFAAHLIGYINNDGRGTYGIEEYFDDLLAGKDGRVIGLATPWIGEVGANTFEIQQPENGQDVYLSIDPIMQKEVELIAQQFLASLYADSISVTILDPWTGKVRAMVNAPDFNPNNIGEAYRLLPVGLEQHTWIVSHSTYVDVPLYYLSGDRLVQATVNERQLPGLEKYYFENMLGPQAFVNKNISMPYEPGSIMKGVTLGIGLDTDMVGLYEYYNDPGEVRVGEFTITNVARACIGEHTFLHALEFSCNVGMIRLAQKLSKYLFYNYMERLGFGKRTGIELAGEEAGRLPDFNSVSVSQFFNNTYGQGMLATPLQMAVAYAALINGGVVYQPSIVQAIRQAGGEKYEIPPKVVSKVFRDKTSEEMRTALESVLANGGSPSLYKPGYTIGGKTGTAQIAFRGRYQTGAGWTNGSVMGVVSVSDPRYVIAVQVRRPRTTPWAEDSAGKVFNRIVDFLINYERLEE